MKNRVLILSILLLSWASPVMAGVQSEGTASDEIVKYLAKAARAQITVAWLDSKHHVPAETPAEKARPLIPFKDEKRVVERGMHAGALNYCGLPWKSGYADFMKKERASKKWNNKQMAYISLLHGVSQGYREVEMKGKGICPAGMKTNLGKKAK